MDSLQYKCHFCPECHGDGCIGELPGMGGFSNSINFQLNCQAWLKTEEALRSAGVFPHGVSQNLPAIRLAPITGGVENIGYSSEKAFYQDMQEAALYAGLRLSIGDGCPDEKLLSGIEAVKALQHYSQTKTPKAAVFIKPYPDKRILERIEWSQPVAEIIGVDIDSYNIVTMRNLVQLERKTATQLITLKKKAQLPFAIKGVFTISDIELIKEVKPDIVVISNHGGRVENRIGSTLDFLIENNRTIHKYCDQLWIDGGIRRSTDLLTATRFDVKEVMIGRPFISALCSGGRDEVRKCAEKFHIL